MPIKQAVIDSSDKGGCKLPSLDPFDSSVTRYMDKMAPLQCRGVLFTEYKNNVLKALKAVDDEGKTRANQLINCREVTQCELAFSLLSLTW